MFPRPSLLVFAGLSALLILLAGGLPLPNLKQNSAFAESLDINAPSISVELYLPSALSETSTQGQVLQVAAGQGHACALLIYGSVKCWGRNNSGQLGDGTTMNRPTPVDVKGLSEGVKAIAAGTTRTCAVTTSGAAKCWGANGNGGIGDGTGIDRHAPVNVTGLSSGVAAIAVGSGHTCALMERGGIKCWGNDGSGQLGDGTTAEQRRTPIDVIGLSSGVTAIAVGTNHTCARTGSGVKCWGQNFYGQLGDGTRTDRYTPVDVIGLAEGIASIDAGEFHSCAVAPMGVAKCWGSNGDGQVGDGPSQGRRLEPVVVRTGVATIGAKFRDTCALTTSGEVLCWGNNTGGQLGDGTKIPRAYPDAVHGLSSGVRQIAVGGSYNCGLMESGEVKCWGHDGIKEDLSPVDIIGLEVLPNSSSVLPEPIISCHPRSGNDSCLFVYYY